MCRASSVLWLHIVTCKACVSCTVWRYTFTQCTIHTPYRSQYAKWHVVPRCRSPKPCLPQQQDTIPYAVKISVLTLLKVGKLLPETCWADLGGQWIVIIASSWFLYITFSTDFRKIFKYPILSKSILRESSCCMRTDGNDEADSRFPQFYDRA